MHLSKDLAGDLAPIRRLAPRWLGAAPHRLLRALAAVFGARWPMAAPVRYLSYATDSTLLTAALMLVTILPSAVFSNGWLLAKLVVLAFYIVLGSYALKRARSTKTRTVCLLSAAAAYLAVVSIALAHHPLGFLSRL